MTWQSPGNQGAPPAEPEGSQAVNSLALGERLGGRGRPLPVGWAALLINIVGAIVAAAAALSGVDPGTAVFLAGVLLAGTVLGLAAWDLVLALLELIHPRPVPRTITFGLPRRLVPSLSPAAFVFGILIGHQFWQ